MKEERIVPEWATEKQSGCMIELSEIISEHGSFDYKFIQPEPLDLDYPDRFSVEVGLRIGETRLTQTLLIDWNVIQLYYADTNDKFNCWQFDVDEGDHGVQISLENFFILHCEFMHKFTKKALAHQVEQVKLKPLTFVEVDSDEFKAETPITSYCVHSMDSGYWIPSCYGRHLDGGLARWDSTHTKQEAMDICSEHYSQILDQLIEKPKGGLND